MKILGVESLHADAGWRVFSFLKLTTDQPGLVGWSEYNETPGNRGLSAAIRGLAELIVGEDPLAHERLHARLYAATRQVSGGIAGQAIAAIENAALDAKAKALGVPVYTLFGGPLRDRIRLYWSHCGNYRLGPQQQLIGKPPLRSLEDIAAVAREVRERGFGALKTNPFRFHGEGARIDMPGFGRGAGWPELNWDPGLLESLARQMAAFRDGAGPEVELMLDLNFNFKTEGLLQIARRLEPLGLSWLEMDSRDPAALASVRRQTRTPVRLL